MGNTKALAKQIIARLDAQGLKPKSKKRDSAALEMVCGAVMALELVQSHMTQAASFMAMMVSVRGASALDEYAKEASQAS